MKGQKSKNEHSSEGMDDSKISVRNPVGRPVSTQPEDTSARPVRRTVKLRINRSAEKETLIADIIEDGSTVISDGAGVIVIEGTSESIEKLRRHKQVVDVEEPRQMQMKVPSMKSGKDDTSGGF